MADDARQCFDRLRFIGGRPSEMKIAIDIDCTPEEARLFLGLPDVRPLQDELLRDVQERMTKALQAMDPETMIKTWLPASVKGFEQLQQIFLAQLGGGKRPET
jgi:Family of unknown function (DUF6489)